MAYPLPLPAPTTIQSVISYTYNCVFAYPLWRLYYRWHWRGREPEDICSHLTTAPAEFWRKSSDTQGECVNLIKRDFTAWLAFEEFLLINGLIIIILISLVRWAINKIA